MALPRPALVCLLQLFLAAPFVLAENTPFASIRIPRVDAPPKIESFLNMQPDATWAGKLVKVEGFKQREPSDDAPASERTDVYLGYDDKSLYAIFVCFDSNPSLVRARMSRREDIFDDDFVELMLDTFNDHRHANMFLANPLGVQADALWTEGPELDPDANFDFSFDTIWNSAGKLTDRGYVVWMEVPFRSLRFASTDPQTWTILLARDIPRKNEKMFWPHYSRRIIGRLNQAGQATGLEKISPGRNLQLIPYGVLRSFKELDVQNPLQPAYSQRNAFGQLGLDAKIVLKDKFVIDATVNPDFSQIESDQPQITNNQRFEVFFPETRPFFQENANYFRTPIQLLFTRRIADPKWGVRVTGKDGPWSIGTLIAGTDSPGEETTPGNPLYGQKALFAVGRVSRDFGSQSSVGLLYADREVNGYFNRVASIDGRFTLNDHWAANVQGVFSATINPPDDIFNLFNTTGAYQAGSAAEVVLERSGHKLNYLLDYGDRSPNFRSLAGFDPQPDINNIYQRIDYKFRPEGKHLISWGPMFEVVENVDHEGTRLNSLYIPAIGAEFIGRTFVRAEYAQEMETLRPQDFSIPTNEKYVRHTTEIIFESSYFRRVTLQAHYRFGTRINYDPPYDPNRLTNYYPFLAHRDSMHATLTVRPTRSLKIDNTYLLFHLRACPSCATPQPELARPTGSLTDHILRTKWNYQFTKELSLRFIGEYNAVLANPNFTSLATTKNFNLDLLATYLVHPNTAVYIGYNTNLENIDPLLASDGSGGVLHLPNGRLRNDGRNLFVKVSYLFRF